MGESEGSDDGGRRGENETGRWSGNRLVVGLRLCVGAMVRPWQCVFRKNTQDNRFVVGTGPLPTPAHHDLTHFCVVQQRHCAT